MLGTASSESALPRLLIKLERLGCAKQTVGLVLPTGYAFNLDGTSIFMAMGVMFISHAYGVPLSIDHQIGILLLMLLTSKGAATVSGGSFVGVRGHRDLDRHPPGRGARGDLRRLPLPVDGDRDLQHDRQQRRRRGGREVVGHLRPEGRRAAPVSRALPANRRGGRRNWTTATCCRKT